jgi:hypothetical protein
MKDGRRMESLERFGGRRGEESRCFWKAVKLKSGTAGPGFEIIYFLRCTQFHNKQHNGNNIGQEKAEEC